MIRRFLVHDKTKAFMISIFFANNSIFVTVFSNLPPSDVSYTSAFPCRIHINNNNKKNFMTKKLLATAAIATICAGQIVARQLTPSEALARLMNNNIETVANTVRAAKASNQLRLAYTATQRLGNSFYVYNCDETGQKLSFGCEFYDLTESNDEYDVYWLSNYAKTDAEELAPGASIKKISVEILPELEAGHMYEINPIFYVGVDDSLDDDAYWDALDNQAQYVDLGKNDPPVIEIEGEIEGISFVGTINKETAIYDINGCRISANSVNDLKTGAYIVKDARGVRKIVKK